MTISFNFNDKIRQRYKKYWDMYRNEPSYRQYNKDYVAVALPQEVAKLYRDMAFSKNITPIIKDEEASKATDRLIYENDLNVILSEASITVAVKGGVVIKNYLDNGQSKITYIQPEYYFPILDPLNQRKIISETIAVPVTEGEDKFLYTETYEKRNGTYWCITKKSYFNDNELGEEIKKETNEVNTYLTESPLTYVPFSRNNSDFYGYSLFFGLEPIFKLYNHILTRIEKIQSRHSAPNIIVYGNYLDEDSQWTTSEHGIIIPVEDGMLKPEYMQYDGELEANFRELEELLKLLQYLSPLNASLYGQNKESANSSALSIKLKAFRSAQTIDNSLKYWNTVIKKVLFIAQQLDVIAGNGTYEPELPRVELKSALPEDSFTQAQEEQLKIAAKNTSIKSSIARLNPHYTNEEIQNEFLEIINEENIREQMSFLKESDDLDFQNQSIDELQKVIANG